MPQCVWLPCAECCTHCSGYRKSVAAVMWAKLIVNLIYLVGLKLTSILQDYKIELQLVRIASNSSEAEVYVWVWSIYDSVKQVAHTYKLILFIQWRFFTICLPPVHPAVIGYLAFAGVQIQGLLSWNSNGPGGTLGALTTCCEERPVLLWVPSPAPLLARLTVPA